MGIIVRFFMFAYAVIGLGVALVTLLVATQALDLQFIYQQLNNYIGRWELILAAAIWILFSLSVLLIAILGKTDKAVLVQVTEFGKVHMSIEALQKLIEKHVKKIAGLHNIKSEIKHNEQLIGIKIMADALPECKVAEITKIIQENVSQGIKDSIGREVNSIEVHIKDINNQPK